MTQIRSILVATDFSDTAKIAVLKAIELVQAFHASLEVLHVIDDPYEFAGQVPRYLPEADAFLQTLKDAANRDLNRVLTPEEVTHYRATLNMSVGKPAAEIVRFAKDRDVDMVVVGTHGRGAVWHMLLGSVAEQIVRNAHCPVLTVRNVPSKGVLPGTTVSVPSIDIGLI